MDTNPVAVKSRNTCLVSGFLRECEWFNRIVPDILKMFVKYYSSAIKFNVNHPAIKGCDCVFSNGNMTVRMKQRNVIPFECLISMKDYHICEWEIIVDQIGMFTYLGFLDAPLTVSMNRRSLFTDFLSTGCHSHHYAISISHSRDYVHIFLPNDIRSKAVQLPKNKSGECMAKFSNGDKFRFVLNFYSKTCDLYCNDILIVKNCFKDFGDFAIPVVSSSGGEAQYTIAEVNIY